ncbi:SspB family protein [Futiania mangrovi]|uniref:ClpXP protease specificity-enhancing factor SspB n=1 Tax=Futiania mangrovi TaxID=2959716 RepID=A0A9J6PBA2_9PROT|nr:ClpXP protease specificity-enhancing factor SspB [Futiania mangrovii]MCP1334976.1 ClpXP protease specificity-enhancing factor SspB [Futiania mangrovii]
MSDRLRYDRMVQDAMLGVVRHALREVAEDGLPGEHHFYITYATGVPGVDMPAHLRERFPDELTIVLQHEFWDLEVGENAFSVTLNFNSVPARLTIPFSSIMHFYDPSVKFGLQFTVAVPCAPEAPVSPAGSAQENPDASPAPAETGEDARGEVISLDQFRKKT